MTRKRIGFSGYIELPDAAELPAIGSKVHAKVVAEVDGDHKDRRRQRGGKVETVRTAPTTIVEGSSITKVEPPSEDPELFDGDGDGE